MIAHHSIMQQQTAPMISSSPAPAINAGSLSSHKRRRAPDDAAGRDMIMLPKVCRHCQLVSNDKNFDSRAASTSPPPHRTQAKGSEEKAKSSKKAKIDASLPSPCSKEQEILMYRFAPKSLVPVGNGTGEVFALFQEELERLEASGFSHTDHAPRVIWSPSSRSPRADDPLPSCTFSKAVGIAESRFDELKKLKDTERRQHPDYKEFEACVPWLKEGFILAGNILQKTFPLAQPLPHGSISCFWEGVGSRLGTAQYPSRSVREEMWWEHCHGYFADFSFSIQNYTKDGSTLQTTPRAEWLKLAFRNCCSCEAARAGKYCTCTHDLKMKPSDEVIAEHVMLSSKKEQVPRRSPSCWFQNDFLRDIDKRKGAFEFLKLHANAMCPEALFKDITRKFNASLTAGGAAQHELTTDEVLAVMLYSGPMYLVYNGLLSRSQFPLKPENAWQHHNQHESDLNSPKHSFLTTITVLLSALRKISLTTRLPADRLLYRGTSGRLHLPDCFWGLADGGCSDANSVRGYTEFGFQSFTRQRDVAITYSGAYEQPSRPFPAILKFKAAAIDRGADVSLISQYPQEVEFLIPPFSFIAPDFDQPSDVKFFTCEKEEDATDSPKQEGERKFAEIPVRVNVNNRSLTMEELKLRKGIQHLQTFKEELSSLPAKLHGTRRKLIDEKTEFSPHIEGSTVDNFIHYIVLQCKQERRAHKNRLQYFHDHQFAHQMSLDMLNCLQWAHDKLKLWLCRGTFFNSMTQHAEAAIAEEAERKKKSKAQRTAPSLNQDWWTLRRCHRLWLAHVRRQIKSMSEISHPTPQTVNTSSLIRYSTELLAAKGRCIPLDNSRRRFNTDNELLVVEAGADGWDAEDIDALAACENPGADPADLHCWVDEIKKNEDELDDVTGMSGLLKACESGNEVTATHFLSAPYFANVRKTCKSGATPLFYAAANGHPRIIDLLHSRQADLNARVPPVCDSVNTSRIIAGQTPLCIAAKFGHTECVRRLLQLRADPSVRNSRGHTALDIASEDSSGLAEKLPQWSETPRVHQFRSCVELLRDAMYPNQVPGGGGFGGQFDATGAST